MSGIATDVESSADTMKILLATDNHIGYMDKDGTRGNDSINTFEEILQIALREDVDFILLGGDLFHENKPSRCSLVKTMELLRRYCHGDKPCQVELLSDPTENFGLTGFPVANYEDPNLNISIPVFSIHGNHDDPAGNGNFCSLDILHTAGLVNYFGKVNSLESITISPILLRKGSTHLALYGLGALRDERLHRMFCHKEIKMLRPVENTDDWCNIFVIHQNRAKHGPTNYIPEQFLDDFLDLVFWGHEHECLIEPTWNGQQNFYVTQPGSSIATSLSEGETKEKGVGLLLVRGHNFKVKKIPLETVRQFYLEEIILTETSIEAGEPDTVKKIENFCNEKMEVLLERAERDRIGKPKTPNKPLIRLRITYTDQYELFSANRFGQRYVDRVANPKDIVQFHRYKVQAAEKRSKDGNGHTTVDIDVSGNALDSTCVEDMVKEFFLKADKSKQLNLLTEIGMNEAVKEFVEKDEKDAIEELVKYQLQKTQEYLKRRNTTDETLLADVQRFKEERTQNVKDEERDAQEALTRARIARPPGASTSRKDDDDEEPAADDDEDDGTNLDMSSISTAGRGRGGRGSRVGRGARGGRGRGGEGSGEGRGRGRGGSRGRGETSRGKRGTNQSIKDAFSASVSRNNKSSSEDECSIIDDHDDTTFQQSRLTTSKLSKPQAQSTQRQSGASARRGVAFDDDDDDDEFDRMMSSSRKK